MIYFCCDTLRRDAVRDGPLNGIDFVEVLDLEATVESDRQRYLYVYLINDPGGIVYDETNLRIDGSGRPVTVVDVTMGLGGQTNVVVVEVASPGDFSTYRLRIVTSLTDDRPPPELDPVLASIDFTFKAECPSPFDCVSPCACPDETVDTPNISYLARDFDTFRNLMLNRMAEVAPAFVDRNAADLGVVIVEILAYLADRFAYQQEATHGEAFLRTLRSRISAKRLGRLVDYHLDEGANARCFCHVAVTTDVVPLAPDFLPVLPAGTAFATLIDDAPVAFARDDTLLAKAGAVFETLHDVSALFADHNEMRFYTFSDRRCSLPAGATAATLLGHHPELVPGMFLAIEEVVGPATGNSADRDLNHRQVVRLTEVTAFDDGGVGPRTDPVTGAEITEIAWRTEDALRFPVCLSAETGVAFGRRYVEPVSVARGNIVLADHGRLIADEDLGAVPAATLAWAPGRGLDTGEEAPTCASEKCDPSQAEVIPARYRPSLKRAPLTFAAPFDAEGSAAALLRPAIGDETPAVILIADDGSEIMRYAPVTDLLASSKFSWVFTVEVEETGKTEVRFGDGVHGFRPTAGTAFTARYRIGNGLSGNIGADKLRHIALALPEIARVRNITPARGGRDRETIAEMRRRAPYAYRRQERAVTRADYVDVGTRLDWVQDIAASYVHTGSWLTAFCVADPRDRLGLTPALTTALREHFEPFRMAGRDLEVEAPDYVPLEITLRVCVEPNRLRSPVLSRLRTVFSGTRNPDGTVGFFHPDNFTFGETLHLSPLIATAQAVPGVRAVSATRFRRLGDPRTSGLIDRKLTFGRREIPRVDSDPSNQGNGILQFDMVGGR